MLKCLISQMDIKLLSLNEENETLSTQVRDMFRDPKKGEMLQ